MHRFWGSGHGYLWGAVILPTTEGSLRTEIHCLWGGRKWVQLYSCLQVGWPIRGWSLAQDEGRGLEIACTGEWKPWNEHCFLDRACELQRGPAPASWGWVKLQTEEVEKELLGGRREFRRIGFREVGNHLCRLLYLCPERILKLLF